MNFSAGMKEVKGSYLNKVLIEALWHFFETLVMRIEVPSDWRYCRAPYLFLNDFKAL